MKGEVHIKRPIIWFSIMFICSIYISDFLYNKDYVNVIIVSVICILNLCYAYKKNVKDIQVSKEANIGGKSCVCFNKKIGYTYMLIGIMCFIIGIYITVKKDISLVENNYNNKNFSLNGVVTGVSQKTNSYAISISDISNLDIQTDTINIYEKDKQKIRKLLVYVEKNKFNVDIGDEIFIRGKLNAFSKATNKGQFDEYKYYVCQLGYSYKVYTDDISNNGFYYKDKGKSLYYRYKRNLYNIRESIRKKLEDIYPADKVGIIEGMLIGEKYLLDEDTKAMYKDMGISHILAISGLHISLIGMIIYKVLLKCRVHIYVNNILTIMFLFSYGIMTDFSVSTNRAIVMMTLMLIGSMLGKTYDIYASICISLFIILMQNPLQIYNTGLQFSFAAILGICVVYPSLKKIVGEKTIIKGSEKIYVEKDSGEIIDKDIYVDGKDVIRKFIESAYDRLLASFSIYLMNIPIMIKSYYQVSIVSVIINIIVLAFVEVLMCIAIISVFVGFISVGISKIIASGAIAILDIYEKLGDFIKEMGIKNICVGDKSTLIVVFYYAIIIFTVYLLYKSNHKVKRYAVLYLICLCIFVDVKAKDIVITMLDVSQGDGICIESINGKTITFDGGSSDVSDLGKYRLEPFLKSKGIQKINYAFFSHVDSDHTSGILEMIENDSDILVKNIVLPYINDKSDKYNEIERIAIKKQIKLLYVKAGDSLVLDGIKFSCIHPIDSTKSEDENGYSAVFAMEYKEFDMLFTGDIGTTQDEDVFDNGVKHKNNIDVMKVPHHGSKNSSSEEFIEFFNPKYAIVSAGENNMYGHPHSETLKRYANNKTKVYSTINNGAITIKTDGENIKFYGIKK